MWTLWKKERWSMSYSSEDSERRGEIYSQYKGAVLGIYGWSDSGKTELAVRIISELKSRGYRVLSAKHTVHEMEHGESKDSERHYHAGTEATLFFNDREGEIRLRLPGTEGLKFMAGIPHDIIIVEGMKGAEWPKIAVGDIEKREGTVLSYPETSFEEVIEFIEGEIKRAKAFLLLPGLDCGLCGHTCYEMASLIASGTRKFADCVVLKKRKDNRVRIMVGGKEVDLGKKFMDDLFYNTLTGMIKTLKGVGSGDVEITIRRDGD